MAGGQFLGPKVRVLYTSDDGRQFNRQADTTLAAIVGTDNAVSGALEAPDGAMPGRYTPRGVYWQGNLDGKLVRKFLVCGTPEAPLYAAVNRTAVSIDGVAGITTGRRGERVTY